MKNKIIKFVILTIMYLLGTYLIQKFIPWNVAYSKGFTANFIVSSILYLSMGMFGGANSLSFKAWNKKSDVNSFIVITVSLAIYLLLSIGFLTDFRIMLFNNIEWISLNRMYLDNGLKVFFPYIIGHNVSKIVFKQ